ncbi:hypothetical protein EVB98_048 [Rhizobium phage RHph_N3_2]|nr:hypothetical protein EVB98_048 [Rhizobium phage RHph_N3_2]
MNNEVFHLRGSSCIVSTEDDEIVFIQSEGIEDQDEGQLVFVRNEDIVDLIGILRGQVGAPPAPSEIIADLLRCLEYIASETEWNFGPRPDSEIADHYYRVSHCMRDVAKRAIAKATGGGA